MACAVPTVAHGRSARRATSRRAADGQRYAGGFRVHFTPTYSSWINQVERLFAELTNRAIRRGSFGSVKELERAIAAYLDAREATPFIWTASADSILESIPPTHHLLTKPVRRGRACRHEPEAPAPMIPIRVRGIGEGGMCRCPWLAPVVVLSAAVSSAVTGGCASETESNLVWESTMTFSEDVAADVDPDQKGWALDLKLAPSLELVRPESRAGASAVLVRPPLIFRGGRWGACRRGALNGRARRARLRTDREDRQNSEWRRSRRDLLHDVGPSQSQAACSPDAIESIFGAVEPPPARHVSFRASAVSTGAERGSAPSVSKPKGIDGHIVETVRDRRVTLRWPTGDGKRNYALCNIQPGDCFSAPP